MKIKMMTDIEFNEFKIKIGMESKPEESCTRRKGKKKRSVRNRTKLDFIPQ